MKKKKENSSYWLSTTTKMY